MHRSYACNWWVFVNIHIQAIFTPNKTYNFYIFQEMYFMFSFNYIKRRGGGERSGFEGDQARMHRLTSSVCSTWQWALILIISVSVFHFAEHFLVHFKETWHLWNAQQSPLKMSEIPSSILSCSENKTQQNVDDMRWPTCLFHSCLISSGIYRSFI